MRCALAMVIVLIAAVAQGAEESTEASGSFEGKRITFPAMGIADGVKATLGLLESCHDESLYRAEERENAEQGDHIRLLFAEPVAATVMGERVAVLELLFRPPLNTGVFWVRAGDRWRRYTKYEFQKEEPFTAWLRTAQPAE